MDRRPAWPLMILLLAGLSCVSGAEGALPEPDLLDRRMAAEQLQNYSDYGGWEAHFEVDGDEGTTLVMTGSLLCAEDFPELVPPEAWALVPEAGFTSFRCRLPGDGDEAEVTLAIERAEP
jgi:hypothetical protein